MPTDLLANAILADRQRQAERPKYEPARCFACDRTYVPKPLVDDDSTRFCSDRCRTAFDNGFPPYTPPINVYDAAPSAWKVVVGPPGLAIGSTYYRSRSQRQAKELIRPRQHCQSCGTALPVWHRGRKVPNTRKFCDGCRS